MSLEQQIKDLQRLLALKQAYSNVVITFDESNLSIPEDVREEVIAKLKAISTDLGSSVEKSNEKQEIVKSESQFTEDEVAALKLIAEATLIKMSPTVQSSSKKAEPVKKAGPKMATILMTDNIPVDRRKLVQSGELVKIINLNETQAVIENAKRDRFVIPVEDLEINE